MSWEGRGPVGASKRGLKVKLCGFDQLKTQGWKSDEVNVVFLKYGIPLGKTH